MPKGIVVSINQFVLKAAAVAFAATAFSGTASAAAVPYAGDGTYVGSFTAGQGFQISNTSAAGGSMILGETNIDKWVFDIAPGPVAGYFSISFNPNIRYTSPFNGFVQRVDGGTCTTVGAACTQGGSATITDVAQLDETGKAYFFLNDLTLETNRFMLRMRYTPDSTNIVHSYTGDVSFEAVPAPAVLGLLGIGLAGMGITSRRKKA